MDTTGISQVINNSKLIYPNEEKVRKTAIGSQKAFTALLTQSRQDPASFWSDIANELIWFEPWTETIRGSYQLSFFCRWYQ
ncbi:acetyl-coenzyme A synthetase N-terminal domain-containing protein [Paracerasibacillus soli]|uniref:Acetyl-coenzyme A synthetase N-terminal domain-containing protein n=1 Tax=Paracerasibacillus soli TaxID=480284 RepID=A0ABU5CRC8_9BACI|nr:acetyl-coenzyme A synthetase N-terminal domain-containing protein [Virgibacillus soli]MDY0408010.1 acetyl-coenzyme A synthetase N-terminal domain-containing protein [Virgibacillus soli]